MPKVTEYSADVTAHGLPPTRNATGADFGAQVGDAIGKVGNAVGDVADVFHKEEVANDVTNVRVNMAKTRADLDIQFRDQAMKSKPGDPNFAENFAQQARTALDAQGDNVTTREGRRAFDTLRAELDAHFTEKAGVFAVQSAGVKATQDWNVSQRAYATSVITDPTSYDSVLNQALTELNDRNGQYGRIDEKVRADLVMKARDTLANAYVNGLIDNGAPELARKVLMDGKLDDQLEPKDKERLVHQADAGITNKRVASEHADALARRQEKDRINQANLGLNDKFMAQTLSWSDVKAANLPAFGEGSEHTWMTIMKQQAKDLRDKPATTQSAVYSDVLERIRLPYGDPRKILSTDEIYKLYGKGLSSTDADRLVKKLQDDKSDDGHKLGQLVEHLIQGQKPLLDKSTMNSIDQGGSDRVAAFRDYVDQQVEDAHKRNEDPRKELLNRNSPKWLGHAVPQFQTGSQRTQADLAKRIDQSLDKSTKGRLPGETPAQFLERNKK